ncbi:T9SS type A sorting domain-containing protein [Flavobacterium sp.]|jgi:uncharacterized repeat protein (TIGR01451 family)|uniref:DUF7619 domain-containing protein n=1 Tax=Flavobacterium sp. TaxID=239 RepID=UPI0037C15750
MKKLIILVLLITGFANAQVVNIPDVNFKNKLIDLGYDTNSDGNIQQSEALSVYGLSISNSNISDLTGIQSFTNLTSMDCSYNQLTQLNVSGLTQLITLQCNNNQISNLNVTNCVNLSNFVCSNNLLTSLDFSGVTSLSSFLCSYNSITNFNFTNLVIFNDFFADHNQISNLDLSMVNITGNGEFSYNPLQTINIKNGFSENLLFYFYFSPPNPALQFICADDNELVNVNNYLASSGLTNVVVNSYCFFTPGGDYNTINGQVLFDSNSNGCDSGDSSLLNVKMKFANPVYLGWTFTNSLGNYTFYSDAGNFQIYPDIENPSWFNVSPATASISFVNNNNNTSIQNFCISANGIHPDLEIVIAPITPARPGFDAVYQIVYKNKGNQTLSQLYGVNFFFNQNLMDFVSATTAPATTGSGSLSWSYANLLPFESRSIYVTLNINTPTDINYPVNIGDILQFTTSILPIAGDETTSDNTFLFNQTVVGSYDPNDITCIEGTSVSPSLIGEYLHYVINFENTGTAAVENVVVKATIDTTKFNLNSLQLLNTSHPSYVKITGNIVEFIFENIALDTGGHGNILLKIRSKGTLQSGDNVSNRGDIFFDYNAPIDTGIANTIFQSLNNSAFEKDNSVVIFPNPTQSIINVKSENSIKSIQLYDVQGRLLQTKLTDEISSSIDISDKSKGIYFLKVTSDKGIKVERIVKE